VKDNANNIYYIFGHVIGSDTRQGLAGLRVEVWDRDVYYDVLMGQCTTDEQGNFYIRLCPEDCEQFYLDDHPHLFFRVFVDEEIIKHTEQLTLWRDLKAGKNRFTITVEDIRATLA
jgi:hypothetical protein